MAEEDDSSTDRDPSAPQPGAETGGTGVASEEQADNSAVLLVTLDILGGMTESAKKQYKDCIKRFGAALAREASRLEEADRPEEIDKPEITTAMIVKANDLLRHPASDSSTSSIRAIVSQTTSFGLAIATPITFGANLPAPWHWTTTVASGILAVASQVYATILTVRRK